MTDQSGRYGAQGDQAWFPGEQQQPPQYGQQQDLGQQQEFGQQQYPQGYVQQQGVPQQGMPLPGVPQQQMPQQQVQQQVPQQQMPMGGQGYPQQQGFVQQQPQGYPQQQGMVQPGMTQGGQQQFGQDQFGQQQGFAPGQPMPQQGMQQQAMPQAMPPQQAQMPMGGQGYPQQRGASQGGQQQFVQQGVPQSQPMPQGMQGMQQPVQGMPQQAAPRPVQQQPAPQARPAGPGPDGIDWEAEAAALDNPGAATAATEADQRADEPETWAEDEYAEEERSSFLSEQDNSREAERKRKEKGKKSGRRNSGACLVVALVLLGATGGAGWWGYGQYQQRFGPPPDFNGDGNGSVNITVASGAVGGDIARVLRDAGVVKSIKAFTVAYDKNPKARGIQPGIYTMKHEMSGDAAVKELVESNGGNVLIMPEGMIAADIYTKIDEKLKLEKGTTAKVAKDQAGNLGLPAYANNNPEGFLYPTRYSVTDGMKPEDLLKQMVGNAVQRYNELKLDEAAQKIGLKNAYEVITEASILQAEGNNDHDFGKMARAISNRLTTNVTGHKLGLDTTLQYQLGRKELSYAEINDRSLKYNTNMNPGLPPTPISNPSENAIRAVLNPTPGDWAYWLAISPSETKFAATGEEHAKNTENWCISRGKQYDSKQVVCK
ncbi:endolytic transglycosylase MltG [Kitasatospora sp. CB01950]|uniref:endolytic transglycosylase MltG n=1 Tax=Kitasatospora sp. CB01950 TaxID=1703930 RepID=UPI0009392494|nr:endolytic transglycosylase MltG [Kitasatospora sp. CB01950]